MADSQVNRISRAAYYADVHAIIDELDAQTDRGAAIVGAGLLDDRLMRAINVSLDATLSKRERQELFDGPTAPLGSYSARVRIARAIGLINESLASDLRTIGKVRNKFAHYLDIREFRDLRIAENCRTLVGKDTVRVERDGSQTPVVTYNGPDDARRAFIVSVQLALHMIYVSLSLRGRTSSKVNDDAPGV